MRGNGFGEERKGAGNGEKFATERTAKRTTAAVSGKVGKRRFFLIENLVTRHCFEEEE